VLFNRALKRPAHGARAATNDRFCSRRRHGARQPKSLAERAAVYVTDHGTVGDGVADDTLALQSAINAARENNSTLRLQDGQYRITSFLDWGDWTGISVRD
jgi:polygalacturonase